jgi:integrase
MRIREFLDDYYTPLRGISPRTVQLYSYTIRALAAHIGREPTLDDLGDEMIVARFLAARQRTHAAATAAKDRTQLRALHEFAARKGLCSSWPAYPPVRVPERVPEAWLQTEMERLLASAAQEQVMLGDVPAADFWRALILTAYDTAERATALISIRWSDVRGGHILFRAETRKGQRRDVLREIGSDTQEALEAIRRGGPADLVFRWPRTYSYLWTRLGVILKRAGLPSTRRDKFHKIRRTTASYYQAAGGSAQALLDHTSPATTRRYLDPRISGGVSAASVIPRVG